MPCSALRQWSAGLLKKKIKSWMCGWIGPFVKDSFASCFDSSLWTDAIYKHRRRFFLTKSERYVRTLLQCACMVHLPQCLPLDRIRNACMHHTFIRFRLFLPYLSCTYRMALEKHCVVTICFSMQLSEVPAKNRRKRWNGDGLMERFTFEYLGLA
jgi:hypothetical protein